MRDENLWMLDCHSPAISLLNCSRKKNGNNKILFFSRDPHHDIVFAIYSGIMFLSQISALTCWYFIICRVVKRNAMPVLILFPPILFHQCIFWNQMKPLRNQTRFQTQEGNFGFTMWWPFSFASEKLVI